jgi:Uma2 family endonuclease
MSIAEKQKMTAEAYLEMERKSEERHEFFGGEVFAMSGTTLRHNTILLNTAYGLRTSLKGKPCSVFTESVRVQMKKFNHYAYPDIVVACGKALLEADADMLSDATVIVEVLSPSTESYDRGLKFQHYQSLDSLKEYVLVSQDQRTVEVYRRESQTEWHYSRLTEPEQVLPLASIACSLTLQDIYDGVSFSESQNS